MKVLELRRLIDCLPDDTEVVAPGRDHDCRRIAVFIASALATRDRRPALYEDYGDANPPELEDSTVRVDVLVAG